MKLMWPWNLFVSFFFCIKKMDVLSSGLLFDNNQRTKTCKAFWVREIINRQIVDPLLISLWNVLFYIFVIFILCQRNRI